MTLTRRIFILPLLAAALIAAIGALGLFALMKQRAAGAGVGHGSVETVVVFPLSIDQTISTLCGLTVAGCAAIMLGALMVRHSGGRRLREFRLTLGSAPTSISDRTGDELDRAANQLNELT